MSDKTQKFRRSYFMQHDIRVVAALIGFMLILVGLLYSAQVLTARPERAPQPDIGGPWIRLNTGWLFDADFYSAIEQRGTRLRAYASRQDYCFNFRDSCDEEIVQVVRAFYVNCQRGTVTDDYAVYRPIRHDGENWVVVNGERFQTTDIFDQGLPRTRIPAAGSADLGLFDLTCGNVDVSELSTTEGTLPR
ncbi:hypothetical protein V0U79_12550 [Hyphobacterium sp. HN65]|uniref:Uncharacterized protein n=1 Tax=Hyphobacterium lacteum TaxID=3116575 RepID=A0ABU7LUH5_9PROT|nr:hypothetical protein [Hyphobacterium sp. HN65]MEE2527199.1 hypothetical protein [Hyphobacterium sp. HN65]